MEQSVGGVAEVMAVFFNEITIAKEPTDNRRLLAELGRVWARLCEATDGREKRILVEETALAQLMSVVSDPELGMARELQQFLCTVMQRPYCPNDNCWSDEVRDRFYGSEFSMHVSHRHVVECKTMGWAYLNGAITVGFETASVRKNIMHEITETLVEGGERRMDVLCITSAKHLSDRRLQSWVTCQLELEEAVLPSPCELDPAEKRINYRDDHGREILDEFARRLVRNKYVVGVVNSIPWRPRCDHFILDPVRADGIVNVCLHWHDTGYGLAVQTTARGVPQTSLVAELLANEYDRRT